MTHLIIGEKSNLSQKLAQNIENSILISSEKIVKNDHILEPYMDEEVAIIFNNFQTATKLDDLKSPREYVEYSIYTTAKVLQYAKHLKINKIIYTSSSSVYGNNILCKETDELRPTSLHAALKVANEKLISQYCLDNKIDYTITRIFNMYGGNDQFSVISKILYCYKKDLTFTVANHGSAIRDFINIEDVINIYTQLLQIKNLPIINLGTSEGVCIKNIIDFLKMHHVDLHVNNITKEEIKMSTADNTLLLERLQITDFVKVEEYLLEQVKL